MTLKRPKAACLDYASVEVGAVYSFEHKITDDDIRRFAELSGDFNPLHVDAAYAPKTKFKKNIAHGMLLAGFFSRILGMMCPGEKCLYLTQDLQFRGPVFSGQKLTVQGIVKAKTDNGQMVTLQTEILADGSKVVTGEAKARFLGGEKA